MEKENAEFGDILRGSLQTLMTILMYKVKAEKEFNESKVSSLRAWRKGSII